MMVAEQVKNKLQNLPPAAQEEVLHFVEFLSQKLGLEDDEDKQWSDFSLAQAIKGLENEDFPEYTETDLQEKWR
ncbi:MAG: DUF2281 domain-containing protein [Pyrinomonadaceae bacterium]|nr:DUF2281 domain-containing protein [Pyrinomonadaceae bacterium]